jgi:hypothetical protein
MSELIDPKLLEALRRDRQTAAPNDSLGRVAARLRISTPDLETTPRQSAVKVIGDTGAHKVAMLVLTLFAGGAAGALIHARFTSAPTTRVIDTNAPAPSMSMQRPFGASPSTITVTEAVESAPAAERPPTPEPASKSTPPAGLSQLDAERALLDTARIALVRGDNDDAIRVLDRHEKTFRRPLLGEEHDALLVQALVRTGRYDEARSRADAFRRRVPQSLLLPAVDAAIASIP